MAKDQNARGEWLDALDEILGEDRAGDFFDASKAALFDRGLTPADAAELLQTTDL